MLGAIAVRLRQHPALYWSVVLLVAAASWITMHRQSQSAGRTRAQWGATRQVLVARRDIAPGERMAELVVRRDVPTGLVPTAAVDTVNEDSVASSRIVAGEIVVRDRIAPGGGGPTAAQLAADQVAVALRPDRLPPAAPGDWVDLIGTAESGSVTIATGRILAVGDETVTVAVPELSALEIADATVRGTVMVALRRQPPVGQPPDQRNEDASNPNTASPATTR